MDKIKGSEMEDNLKERVREVIIRYNSNPDYSKGQYGFEEIYGFLEPIFMGIRERSTVDLNKEILGKLEPLLARSGWEMLPAIIFNPCDSYAQRNYNRGSKDMEKVWHDIIEGVIEEIKKTKEGRE